MKTIDVTCAIIIIESKILVVQRSSNMNLPLKWEFPGGKLEFGESDEDCIKREMKEELNIEIDILSRLTPSIHDYPNISIRLIPFVANYRSGIITLFEHKQYLLLAKDELRDLDWAQADLLILKEFLKL